MKCENTKRRLSEYLDGVLPDEEHAAVEAHVAECTGCRTELEALRRTVEAVAGLPHHRAPAGFRARVAARVRAEAVARPGRGARIIQLWPRLAAVAAMFILAAGITFLVDGGLWLPGSPDGDRLAMKEGREAPAIAPEGGVAGTALTHNGTLDAPAAPPPDEAEDGGLADDKRRSGLRHTFSDRLDAGLEKNGFALGDVVTLKAGTNGRRYEHDRAMDEARKAGDLRPGQPLRQGGLARTADFNGDQPHQVLMLQDSRPILLATQAMDLAARNDGRFDLALVPQGDRGDEIVLVLYIPVEQYEAFLSQVTDLVPMRQQMLRNTIVTKQQPYFQDVLVNYYEQQTGEPITKLDLEAMAISGSGGGPSGPAKSPAAQLGADHETARLFRDRHVPGKLAADADTDAPIAKATVKSKLRKALRESAVAARPGIPAEETPASEVEAAASKPAADSILGKLRAELAPQKLEAKDMSGRAGAEEMAGAKPRADYLRYSRAREAGRDLETAKLELSELSEKLGTAPSRVRLIIRLMRAAPEPTER